MQRRWCGTLWPTAAGAQQAGMATATFAALVERALFLDRDDPVAAWGELRAHQARLIERLAGASELRIEAEGTDLRLSVAGRTWVNSDGRRNMPSGEVFTGPVEDSAEGRIRFTIPSSPRGVAGRGDRARVPRGPGRRGARRARRGLPARDARDRRRRVAARRDRHRHELRHRPPGRGDPVRREDRRHGPPRGRALVSRDGRHERVGRALGHDLRSARRRAAQRRRRDAGGDGRFVDE